MGLLLAGSTLAASFVGIDRPNPYSGERFNSPQSHYLVSDPAVNLSPDTLPEGAVIRIGVQSVLTEGTHAPWLFSLREYLTKTLGASHVSFRYMGDRELRGALKTKKVDIFLADADFFAVLNPSIGAESLASIWPLKTASPDEVMASTLIVKRDAKHENRPLKEWLSHPFVATDPLSVGGWLAAEGLIYQTFHRLPSKLRDEVTFTDRDIESVLTTLDTSPETVGVLPACVLEDLVERGRIHADDYEVLNPQKDSLKCAHSTRAYPGWRMGSVGQMDAARKKAVTAALFSMTRGRDGLEWVLPVNDIALKSLFSDLKVGPWGDTKGFSVERTIRENAEVIGVLIFAILMIVIYALSVSFIVRKKTAELREALRQRDRVEDEVRTSRQHIGNLERVGIIGQMSTLIAHELKQPLGAVTNYGNGLLRRLRRGAIDPQRFEEILEEVVIQAGRASEIVDRVRAYAKQDLPPRQTVDITEIIKNALETFRRSRTTNADVIVRMPSGCMAEVDSWGIELAILNLLKNAADAVAKTPYPVIEISVHPDDEEHRWVIEVADNGPYLSDEALERFFKPLQTSKGNKGMGLGLSIVSSIAEQHAGSITVARNGERGVRFTMVIPRPKDDDAPLCDDSVTIYRNGDETAVIHHGESLVALKQGAGVLQHFRNVDAQAQMDVPASVRGTVDTMVRMMEGRHEPGIRIGVNLNPKSQLEAMKPVAPTKPASPTIATVSPNVEPVLCHREWQVSRIQGRLTEDDWPLNA